MNLTQDGKPKITIRVTVVMVCMLATLLTTALAVALQYYFGQAMAKTATAQYYGEVSARIAQEIRSVGRVNANVIDLLADNPVLRDRARRDELAPIFAGVLAKNPLYYGIYLGTGDGSFYQLINLDSSRRARKLFRAMPADRWLVVEVEATANGLLRRFHYLNDQLAVRFSRSEPTDFVASSRPWYAMAMTNSGAQFTPPYLFAQLDAPGRTVARRLTDSDVVVAIDMTLASTTDFLREHSVAEHGAIYLFNSTGEIIASSVTTNRDTLSALDAVTFRLTAKEQAFVASQPTLTVANELDWAPVDFAEAGQPRGYAVDMLGLISKMTGLRFQFVNGFDWSALVEQFRSGQIDLLQPVVLNDSNRDWGLAGEPFLHLPYALATKAGQPAISDLGTLGGATLAIPAGWSVIQTVRERFPGIAIIEARSTRDALEMVLSGQVFAALDNELVLRHIANNHYFTGLQFHSSPGMGTGTVPDQLYIVVAPEHTQLRQLLDRAIAGIDPQHREALRNRWLETETGTSSAATSVADKALMQIAADPAQQDNLQETTQGSEPYFAYASAVGTDDDPLFLGILAPRAQLIAPILDKVKLSSQIAGGFLLCLLPLSYLFANPIVRPVKQLARENDKVRLRAYDDVVHVDSHIQEINELSDSMVQMVQSIKAHELAQRNLMDSIIKLIAEAIDDKSAYTGGHCERVPELAMMLAEAASSSKLPAFASFQLDNEDQWREYRIAAWLHDCGKITTPEHIVDKGSKLETIYNRIHEIRMRFEVLWRDAEIACMRQQAAHPERAAALADELAATRARLLDDYAFVAACNVGGESLDDDSLLRLQALAKLTWQRHFDDRIGLSPVEELRLHTAPADLPATEQLLADKPEHIIPREQSTQYPQEFGIQMDVPSLLCNLGELYNLSVSRGTLTAEDRFRINEHMISTIKMLDRLPFPDELKNVPRYASTHHETMKGTGYPRRLSGDELSIPERLLAVADVFEALTASDRPYKKAKPVSEAIEILHRMVEDGHIDRDSFELFVRDKVYLRYARAFLAPEQIDAVDESRYLAA